MTCVKSLLNKENKYKPETSRPASKNHFDKPIKYITFPQISNTAPIIIGNLGFLVISDHLKKKNLIILHLYVVLHIRQIFVMECQQ
jgi:hypothetical protein